MASLFSFDSQPDQNMVTREMAKKKLLKLVGEAKRGSEDKSSGNLAVIEAIELLERLNPCDCPVESPLLSGKWSLLYTGAADASSSDRRRKEGPVGSAVTEISGASNPAEPTDGGGGMPLGRRLTTLAGQLVRNRGNFQDIDAAAGRVTNRAALELLGVPVELRIEGRCVPAEAGLAASRLLVTFECFSLSLGAGGPRLTVPLGWADGGRGPRGWVDTTYLDADVRCGRGDKGSVFVTARRPE
jgi:hypothetical protein